MAEQTKTDWVTPAAIALGVAGVGAGLYFFLKKPPKEVKEGEWAEAGTILSRKTFSVTIRPVVIGDWLPANIELGRFPFTVQVKPVVTGDWLPANMELGSLPFLVVILPSTQNGPFILDIASDPIYGGWVTTDPEKDEYWEGDIVVIEAHRFWPYEFVYWLMDGEYLGYTNPMSFYIAGTHTITAVFML